MKFYRNISQNFTNRDKDLSNRVISYRKKEIEDPEDVLNDKCSKLAAAIAKARNLVVYTGAGISTAAGKTS